MTSVIFDQGAAGAEAWPVTDSVARMRRLDARDMLGDTLFGMVGDGANVWDACEPHANVFQVYPEYSPQLNASADFVGPSFVRMQDPALYGGQPFYRFSATGGAAGGWISLATIFDVRPSTLYDFSVVVFSNGVTDQLSLGLNDAQASLYPILDDHSSAAYPYQAQRYSGRYRTAALADQEYSVYPTILLYVGDGAESVTVLDVLEFGMREVEIVETVSAAQTFATPDAATVAADGSLVLVAGSTTTREVTISVPATADVGIHINFDDDATTAKFLIEKGTRYTLRTQQEIRAIKGGSADVTVYLLVGTP